MTALAVAAWAAFLIGGSVWAWKGYRPVRPPVLPDPPAPTDPDDPWEVWELIGDAPDVPDDARMQRRMADIERIAARDGLHCGVCHAQAPNLYYIPLHDDGALCCAVCAQLLDAGALE